VFAALLLWATGDPPAAATVAGGSLILTAVVVAEVPPVRSAPGGSAITVAEAGRMGD
jgi:hypothetical protein